jgi:Helix-turn-helix domain
LSWKLSGAVKAITTTPGGRKLIASEKLFLLILADYSNEATGTSWPSVQRLSSECLCSESTLRRIVKRMVRAGFIEVEHRAGSTSRYTLKIEQTKGLFDTPVSLTPLSVSDSPTPVTAMTPKPSLEPSVKDKHIRTAQLPEWLPANAWNSYLEMRLKVRKPLVTQRGFAQAINKLDKLRQEGHDPSAVLDQSIFNSWQGLFPVKQESVAKARPNGKGSHACQDCGSVDGIHYTSCRHYVAEREA